MAISQINLTDGNDVFEGWHDDSGDLHVVFGKGGNDHIADGDGPHTLHGGDGDDTLSTEAGTLYGDAGNDHLRVIEGRAEGGSGDDTYELSTLWEGVTIVEAAGAAGGRDTITLTAELGASYALPENVETLLIDSIFVTHLVGGWDYDSTDGKYDDSIGDSNGARLYGNAADNHIVASDRRDHVRGGAGNDWLEGGAGRDSVYGDAGNDTVEGGSGDDRLDGSDGNDLVKGGDGNDQIWGSAGNDTLDGGAGKDTLSGGLGNDVYIVHGLGDVVTEAAGAGADKVITLLQDYTLAANVEALEFINDAYTTGTGNALANSITGRAGFDHLLGLGGSDTLIGNAGGDTLEGGDGLDLLNGGAGTDWLHGGAGDDLLTGGADLDLLFGGAGADLLWGDGGADIMNGEAGNDSMLGGLGHDTMNGGDGKDTLRGGDGNDRLRGEAGTDLLHGDAGADRFIYGATSDSSLAARDYIYGFEQGADRIDLSAVDANATVAGNQAFVFTGAGNMFKGAADLWLQTSAIGTSVKVDVTGDGVEDMAITVVGNWSMTAADFIL